MMERSEPFSRDDLLDAVRRQGQGFGPLRGFRRLDLRFFGADVAPPTQVYDAALRYWLDRIEPPSPWKPGIGLMA